MKTHSPHSQVERMLSNTPRASNTASDVFWCDGCSEPLKPGSKNNIFFHAKMLHPNCFVCDTCQTPLVSQEFLETNKKAFCVVHYATYCTQGLSGFTGDLSTFAFTVSSPAAFQIAGYNIHPAIQCFANKPVPRQIPVRVQLYDDTLKTMVKDGFQLGDSKLMCEGTACVKFTHLKLNKLKPIKRELGIQTFVPLDHNFKIQVIIGTHVVFSSTFQVVTTVGHLPPSQRDSLRPNPIGRNKKRKAYDTNSEEIEKFARGNSFNHLEHESAELENEKKQRDEEEDVFLQHPGEYQSCGSAISSTAAKGYAEAEDIHTLPRINTQRVEEEDQFSPLPNSNN